MITATNATNKAAKPVVHVLKCLDPYFTEVWHGRKQFEYRKNDRHYQVGDYIVLHHHYLNVSGNPAPGRPYILARVTYVLLEDGATVPLPKDYAVLGIDVLARSAQNP